MRRKQTTGEVRADGEAGRPKACVMPEMNGGRKMNTKRNKQWMAVMAAGVLALTLGAGRAYADFIPSNNSDSLTIQITPNVDFGVNLTTSGAVMESGVGLSITAGLNTSQFLSDAATMVMLGDFNNQEVSVSAVGVDTWAVDTDETPSTDDVIVYALFSTTSKSARPSSAEFLEGTARHQVTGTPKFAGEPSGSEGNAGTDNSFEHYTMSASADMDNLAVAADRSLWLQLDMPSVTTVLTDQRIQVTLSADTGVTN